MLRNARRLLCCGNGGARKGLLKRQFRFRHLLKFGNVVWGVQATGCPWVMCLWWDIWKVDEKITCKRAKTHCFT